MLPQRPRLAYSSSGADTLGLYISVPFCRGKCTFCNFASGVHPESLHSGYVHRVVADLRAARTWAESERLVLPGHVDTVYLGGGTPSVLSPDLLNELFAAIRQEFALAAGAEITMEAAPGQLPDDVLAASLDCGVNRFSFGVQSFVDAEAQAVGRMHTCAVALDDLARVAAAGGRAGVDLIAGLPGQTAASWRESLRVLAEAPAGHASIYMLEVDEDSRLGREMLLGGVRYGAVAAPSDEATVDMYLEGCDVLRQAGLIQYEISNFARKGQQGQHNLKYWRRQPYLGAGLDAASMLRDTEGRAVRFSTTDDLEVYLGGGLAPELDRLDRRAELEEAWFLELRTNDGVNPGRLGEEFGAAALEPFAPLLDELRRDGLLTTDGGRVRLTERGLLISNDVFEKFVQDERPGAAHSFSELQGAYLEPQPLLSI